MESQYSSPSFLTWQEEFEEFKTKRTNYFGYQLRVDTTITSTWKSFYFRTYAKVALVPYVGGTIAHSLRLIYKFPIVEAPSWIHWAIVTVGGYACLGFILFVSNIHFKNVFDKVLYGLVIFHLGASVILHSYSLLVNNNWMNVFSFGFSYFAIFYFVGLGLYCKTISKRIDATESS